MKRLLASAVAERAGVTVSTITAYQAREQMPAPSHCPTCGHHPTWTDRQISRWLANRGKRRQAPST